MKLVTLGIKPFEKLGFCCDLCIVWKTVDFQALFTSLISFFVNFFCENENFLSLISKNDMVVNFTVSEIGCFLFIFHLPS